MNRPILKLLLFVAAFTLACSGGNDGIDSFNTEKNTASDLTSGPIQAVLEPTIFNATEGENAKIIAGLDFHVSLLSLNLTQTQLLTANRCEYVRDLDISSVHISPDEEFIAVDLVAEENFSAVAPAINVEQDVNYTCMLITFSPVQDAQLLEEEGIPATFLDKTVFMRGTDPQTSTDFVVFSNNAYIQILFESYTAFNFTTLGKSRRFFVAINTNDWVLDISSATLNNNGVAVLSSSSNEDVTRRFVQSFLTSVSLAVDIDEDGILDGNEFINSIPKTGSVAFELERDHLGNE